MRRIHVQLTVLLSLVVLMAGALAIIASVASAQRPTGRLALAQPAAPSGPFDLPATAAAPAPRSGSVTITPMESYNVDMAALGIHPISHPLPVGSSKPGGAPGLLRLLNPEGSIIGTQNAIMSVSPDVVSQSTTSAIATLLANFTPSESIQYYLNGALAATFAANANGRLLVSISTGAGFGYVTVEGVGVTSGKRAGAVAQVLDAAPPVPGLAAGPHANNPTGTGTVTLYGARWIPSTAINLARNGTALGTIASGAAGTFGVNITIPAGADASAVYNAYTSTVGSLAGQSVEERADAGTPPQGDQNAARAFVDRAVLNSAGGTFIIVGEGFQPGETVNLTSCATSSLIADLQGSVSGFLTTPAGAGTYNCVFTGATSGRIARGSAYATAAVQDATNAPSAIVQPATVNAGSGTVTLLWSKLLPSQTGTVYMDGFVQGAGTTNASGYGSLAVTVPITTGLHELAFLGTTGQIAIASLYVLPSGGTPTPTRTATVAAGTATTTGTATATTTPCSAFYPEIEPNNTITNAQILPTANNLQLQGAITPAGEVDYYGFGAAAGQRVWTYLYTQGATVSSDSQITLANALSQTLQFDDDNASQTSLGSNIAGAPITTTGTFYLEVNDYQNNETLSPYNLFLNVTTAPAVPEVEPNDTYTSANALIIGSVITGTIPTITDADVYGFTAGANDRLIIQVDGNPERDAVQFNPNFDVLDAAGTLLLAVDSDSTLGDQRSEGAVFTTTTAATYYVRVKTDATGPTTGTYNVHVWRTVGAPCATATPTVAGGTATQTRTVTPTVAGGTATQTRTVTPTVAGGTATGTATVGPTVTCVPSAGGWTTGPVLPAAVVRAVGVYFPLNGKVYAMGGRSSDAAGSDRTVPLEYTPGGAWVVKTGTYPDAQVNNMVCGVITVTGTPYIYCVGGSAAGATTATARVFRYNPITDVVNAVAGDDWPGDVSGTILPGGVAVLNNKLYVIGGFNINVAMTNQIWEYDPNAGTHWVQKVNLPVTRGYVPATAIGSFIYTGGGSDYDGTNLLVLDTAESYKFDPAANTIVPIPNIPRATGETRAVAVGGKMWVLGGGRVAPNPSTEVDIYDPTTNAWSIGPPFLTARRNFIADSDGSRVWTAGGYAPTTASTVMENYSPAVACGTVTVTPTAPAVTNTATRTNTPVVTNTVTRTPQITSTATRTGTAPPQPTSTATATTAPTTCPVQFQDVPNGSTFYEFIRCLACRGIVNGYPCGGPGEPCPGSFFRPNNNVTRGQVSKIVSESAGFNNAIPSTQWTFQDVPPSGTFWLWVERLTGRGIIGGYPCGGALEPCVAPGNRPYFRPNNDVTRGQLSKIVSGAAGWTETPTGQTFQDVTVGSTFYVYVERVASRGIVTGYPCGGVGEPCVAPGNKPYFRPFNNATRGQMSKIAASAFFPGCSTPAVAPGQLPNGKAANQ